MPPVAANGCPAASEEPLTFSLARSMLPKAPSRPRRVRPNSSSSHAARVLSTVPAKASWISKKSMSARVRPWRASSRGTAKAGAMSSPSLPWTKSTAAASASTTAASLGRSWASAHSSDAEQHGGGAVGQRGGIAGRHGRLGAQVLAENGLEGGQFLRARVGAQVGVAGQSAVGGQEVIEEACVVGGGQVPVAVEGQFVLGLAGDLPLRRGQRLVLAHRQAGARLPRVRGVGRQVLGTEPAEDLQLPGHRLGAVEVKEHLAESFADGDGGVRGGVDAAGDRGIDLAQLDLVGQAEHRFQAGGAGLLEVVRRGLGGEGRAEHRFAGEVEVPGVLEDRPRSHFADPLVLQAEAGDQPVKGGGEHVLVGGLRVGAAGPGERDAVAAHDHGLAELRRACAGVLCLPGGGCGGWLGAVALTVR